MPRRIVHIHKYLRIQLGKRRLNKTPYFIYKCQLPDCSSYTAEEFAFNRQTICWDCGKPFFMSKYHIKMVRPTCGCTKMERKDTLESLIDNVLGGIK